MVISEQVVTSELIAVFKTSGLLPAGGMLGGKAEANEQWGYK